MSKQTAVEDLLAKPGDRIAYTIHKNGKQGTAFGRIKRIWTGQTMQGKDYPIVDIKTDKGGHAVRRLDDVTLLGN
jgi:hypothetical protein